MQYYQGLIALFPYLLLIVRFCTPSFVNCVLFKIIIKKGAKDGGQNHSKKE